MKLDPLSLIDFYKSGHRPQYPEGTQLVYSNFTPRSVYHALAYFGDDWDQRIVNFGLQGVIKWMLIDLWNEEFFSKPKADVVGKYKRRMDTSLGPNAVTVEHIEALHDLGYLPIRILALPEGAKVKAGVPLFTVQNTVAEFFWLTNYLEDPLSAEIWKSATNATIANRYREILTEFAIETGAPLDFVPLQGHDFSFRGMSGVYDAASRGPSHLTSFIGTDNVAAIDYVEDYYNANAETELIGVSVPATEHSVMCMGEKEEEIETIRRLISDLYPTGIISIVSDTWDFWKVLNEYAVTLKAQILAREPNALGLAKVVFRPDSGDPVDILCGTALSVPSLQGDYTYEYMKENGIDAVLCDGKYFSVDLPSLPLVRLVEVVPTAEQKGAVECLWDNFGGTETEKGYKVLHERVGLIYGDSITIDRATQIMQRMKDKGFASCNVVLGIGSYTYQFSTRDTLGFAMKATYGVVNGEGREIFKDPITDNGTKKSARGLLRVVKDEDGEYMLLDQQDSTGSSELTPVFENGKLLVEQTFAEIRERVANG